VEGVEDTAGELGVDVTGVLNADVTGVLEADVMGVTLEAVSDDPRGSPGAEDRATRTLTGVHAAETRDDSKRADAGDMAGPGVSAALREETSCSAGRGSGGSRSTRRRSSRSMVLMCAEGVSATARSR
jgi:hypothetical protein